MAVLYATPALWALLRRQPRDEVGQAMLIVLAAGAALVTGAIAFAFAVLDRDRPLAVAAVLIPLVGAVVGAAGTASAARVHWWLSKDDFAAVADGAPLPCSRPERCHLGWWTIVDSARIDDVTVLWFPQQEDTSCYAGAGLARPRLHSTDDATVRAAVLASAPPHSALHMNRRADGWYTLCLTT